jgi:hypothetical protein
MPTKKYYHKLKQEGRCTICGKIISGEREGMTYCSECAEKESKRRKKIYYENREYCLRHDICPICKRNKIFGDEKWCPECRAKKYNSLCTRLATDSEYYEHRLEKIRNSNHKRLEFRRSNNLCSRCGKPLSDYDNGFVNCKKCRVRNMLRNRNYRARNT